MDDDTRRKIGKLTSERAALQAQIDGLNERIIEFVETSARRIEKELGLPARRGARIVSSVLTSTPAAVARSKGKAKQESPSKPLIDAAASEHMTLRGLVDAVKARGLKISSGGLSLALAGLRPIQESVADAIEELTKGRYKATAENWRGGIRRPSDG